MRGPLPTIALLLLAAAPPPVDAPPPGRVAGPPRQCIPLTPTMASSIEGGRILYEPNGPVWYGNRPVECAVLRRNVAISTVTPGTTLCRGDIVRVFDPVSGVPLGACGLGPFIPYTRIKP